VAVERISENDSDKVELVAVCLSNYSYMRGIDRLAAVAAELDRMGDRVVRFVVAGDLRLRGTLPGDLGLVSRAGGTLADFMERSGVSHRFEFPGHVDEPEALLRKADVLLKPTREDNPWGRDILEALGHGVPVASVGTYDRFVETSATGLLQTRFDAPALADWLIALAEDRPRLIAMRKAAADRVAELCDPKRQAASVARFWNYTACRG
jgi:glycosyltransferase involved in cell wall biosynthesis